MNALLLWSTIAAPLTLAGLSVVPACRRTVGRLMPWAAIPAVALLVFGGTFQVEAPWLLLGARLGVDPVGRVFLGLTAVLWLAAGFYARAYLVHDVARQRYVVFHLLTMAGNLGVTISQDIASFLLFFTVMSMAAYGLISHDRLPASFRAGRIYIIMTVLGEVLLFAAMILLAQETGSIYFHGLPSRLAESPQQTAIVGLLLAGFGIKLGVMPLHMWLPLAHPAAPTPASAVLSGAIIKTGLLGLLRTLPLGVAVEYPWGAVCLVAGLATSLLAALAGMAQKNPKTVLAYSSVSQMGLVTVALGAALGAPAAWPMIMPALLLLAVHHAVTKSALFLGVGVAGAVSSAWGRRVVVAGLLLAALALAGLPVTTGLAAKAGLKYAAAATADQWAAVLRWLLPLTSLTTTLLVARFLWVVWPSRRPPHGRLAAGMVIPWAALTAGVVLMFWVLRWRGIVNAAWVALDPAAIWAAVWPMAAAGILVLLTRREFATPLTRIRVPEGDLVVPLTAAGHGFRKLWNRIAVVRLSQGFDLFQQSLATKIAPATHRLWDRLAGRLENDLSAALLIVLLAVTMFVLALL